MLLDSSHVRLVWSLAESHSNYLKTLQDDAIRQWLMKRARATLCLSIEEASQIERYLAARHLLIREVIGKSPS